MKFLNKIKKIIRQIDSYNREIYVGTAEKELKELQNIFALLNFGVLTGLPSPPVHIAIELLPLCEEEIKILFDRTETSLNPLGNLFSIFDID